MRLWRWTRAASNLAFAAVLALPACQSARAHGGHNEDEMFQRMDSNGDGKISAEEHTAGARMMFEKMDTNHDGKVNATEMTAFHDKMMTGTMAKKGAAKADKGDERGEGRELSAAEKIKVIDSNGDGVVTAEEHAAGSKAMFDKMDTNHDGSLTKAEMSAGHEKLMHKANK